MKKLKLLIAACALLVSAGMQAKTDVTQTYLKDADLSSLEGWGNPGKTNWKIDGAVNVVEFWNWSNPFSFSQTANLPAGYYRLAVNAFYRNSWSGDGTNNNMAWLFAGEKTQNVIALNSMEDLSGYAGSNDLYKAATAFSQGKFSNEFDFNVTGEGTVEVEIGFKGTCPNGGWCILGPVTLWEYTVDDYIDDYRAKVSEAEALYNEPMYPSELAALKEAVVDESTLTTIDEVQAAVSTLSQAITIAKNAIVAYANDVAPFNTLKEQAQAIADVAYTETTAGSHSTYAGVISAQQEAVNNAEKADDIAAAISALKDAIKEYVNNSEPANDGEFFDITCLMANPDFDNNNITGWTKESTLNPNTRIQCNEFFGNAAFDFYQSVAGLPNGSFTLSMKAFQRPGGYDAVYADYANGINNATARVYVNNDASVVKNIMEEMNETRIYTDPNGESAFNTDKQPANAPGFIPNSMEGAAAWFAVGKYQTEVAALVEDGTLRLGFKDDAHSSDVWTLFDEFRLHYYGSSKMIYYKQYLPQLIAEVEADKSNALYTNVTGKELNDLNNALGVDASNFTSEQEYSDAIQAIKDAQTAYRNAYSSYDALVAAKAANKLEKVSANIGEGVFQYNADTNDNLYTSYESAKNAIDAYTVTSESTAAAVQEVVDELDGAIVAYENQTLNAPSPDKRYNLVVATEGHAKNGNAVIIIPGSTSDNNPTGYGMNANFAPNANLNQTLIFTQVSGNIYNISFETSEGTTYLTYGTNNGSKADWANSQIQATSDDSKKGEFKIAATATDNVFNIYNTLTNKTIACQDGGNIYTEDGNADFTLAEASKASISINTSAAGYGTLILPFTADKPEDVKAYTCVEYSGDQLTLVVADAIEANQPYIIEGSWNETIENWGLGAAVENTVGLLTGVYAATTAPVGSYVMQKNNDKVGFYKVAENSQPTVGANRCYVTATGSETRVFFFDAESTGINAIEALTSGDAQIFNASGSQMPALQKGINIVRKADGKSYKVIVK